MNDIEEGIREWWNSLTVDERWLLLVGFNRDVMLADKAWNEMSDHQHNTIIDIRTKEAKR